MIKINAQNQGTPMTNSESAHRQANALNTVLTCCTEPASRIAVECALTYMIEWARVWGNDAHDDGLRYLNVDRVPQVVEDAAAALREHLDQAISGDQSTEDGGR